MRRCASFIAMRLISCTDQRISPRSDVSASLFLGRHLVGVMPDGRHHGKGQHHERDVPVPAMPGAGLVVRQTQFRLGGLERILDRPAPPFHRHQRLDRGASRAPGREEGEFPIREAAATQAKGTSASMALSIIARVR